MIILTGSKGFIGKHFAERLQDEVVLVDQEDAWRLFTDFDDWNKVDLILHQGAYLFYNRERSAEVVALQRSILVCPSQ